MSDQKRRRKFTWIAVPLAGTIILGSVLCFWLKEGAAGRFLAFYSETPIVTIESDDWGALREYDWGKAKKNGDMWQRHDCLETAQDVRNLGLVLDRHHDGRERKIVITANVVFESISRTDGRIDKKSVPGDVVNAWKEALRAQWIFPQLHAMRETDEDALRSSDAETRRMNSPYMIWRAKRWEELPEDGVARVVMEGQRMFQQIFGFDSLSTVAPKYVWGRNADRAFANAGIKYIQGFKADRNPPYYPGEKTESGRIMLARRIRFEPVLAWEKSVAVKAFVDARIKEIEDQLESMQPVALSTHRINYVSSRSLEQAEYGRDALDILLSRLFCRYPNLIVLTSTELGRLIETGTFTDVFNGEVVPIKSLSLWSVVYRRCTSMAKAHRLMWKHAEH